MLKKPKMYNLRLLKYTAGFAVTVAAFYFSIYAMRGIDFSAIFSSQINWFFLVLSIIFFMLSVIVRSMAFTYGVEPDLSFAESMQIVAIGNASNMILPFRAGEALRLLVFPKRYKAARRAGLVLVPGIFDIAFMLLTSAFALIVADFKDEFYIFILKTVSIGFLSAFALIFAILLIIPKTRGKVFRYFTLDAAKMVGFVGISCILTLLSTFTVFASFGLDIKTSFEYTFGSTGGVNILGLIPSSPGNIGIFEWSVSYGLNCLNADSNLAKTAALILHAVQYLAVIPLGIIMYIRFLLTKESIK